MTNNFKPFRFTSGVFILLSVGLLMFLSIACSTRSTTKTHQTYPEIEIIKAQSEGLVLGTAFSPDGKTLAGGSYGETIKLWDVASGNELRTL